MDKKLNDIITQFCGELEKNFDELKEHLNNTPEPCKISNDKTSEVVHVNLRNDGTTRAFIANYQFCKWYEKLLRILNMDYMLKEGSYPNKGPEITIQGRESKNYMFITYALVDPKTEEIICYTNSWEQAKHMHNILRDNREDTHFKTYTFLSDSPITKTLRNM